MKPLCLTPEELFSLTKRQKYEAQSKALRSMGIEHRRRPDGSIAVDRSYYESVTGGTLQARRQPERTQPRWDAG